MRRWLITFVAMAIPCAAMAAERAQLAARILEAEGDATITDPGGKARPATLYGTVYSGERLTGKPGSIIVLGFREDGHLERLQVPANVEVTARGCRPPGILVARALKTSNRKLGQWIDELPKIPEVSLAGTALIKGPPVDRPRLVPIPASTVAAANPAFSWPAIPGVQRYEITVTRSDGGLFWKTTTQNTTIDYAGWPLQPGTVYRWRVAAPPGVGQHATFYDGHFTTATEDQQQNLRQLEELIGCGEPSLLALAAACCERHGFLAEAIQAYERLMETSPNSSAVPENLARLYRRAGRDDDAKSLQRLAHE